MRFNPWALGLTLASAALLSACGSGGSGDNTSVRLLNASVGYANLDLSVNSTTINSKVAYGTVGSYGSVSTGATASQLLDSVNGSSLLSWTPTLTGNSNATIIAYGAAGSIKQTLLQETEPAANASQSKLLVLNRATDAGALDLYLTAAGNTLPMSTYSPVASNILNSSSGYLPLTSGTFRLTLTGTGQPNDVRLDLPSVTLASTSVYTLVAVTATSVTAASTTGGRLVDALLLLQQGAVISYPATSARARLINGLASAIPASANGGVPSSVGTTVAASLNNQSLLPASLAPAIGQYVTTTSGVYTLNLSINGTPVTYTMPAITSLAAGGDYSFLVSGTAAAPVVSLIADDNRLPVAGYTKVRLVNGVAASDAGAGMSVDLAQVANNVQPGNASTPISLITNANLGSRVLITLPSASPALTEKVGQPFYANGVYSAFVLGDPIVPYPIIFRREDTLSSQ